MTVLPGKDLVMKNSTLIRCAGIFALFALFALISQGAKAQISFNFEFDATPDDSLTAPIIGTGTFWLGADPGDGTFAYDSLVTPTSTFTFGDTIFTNDNMESNASQISVTISQYGERRRVQFTDTGDGGGGPYSGSIDFQNATDYLSFEPSYAGQGLNLYFYNGPVGTYLGLTPSSVQATPEPGSIAFLTGLGATGAALALKRRRRK